MAPLQLTEKAPGFATSMFISWKEIASALYLDEDWQLSDYDDDLPEDIANAAFVETIEWVKDYENVFGEKVDDELRLQAENAVTRIITKHWSANSVLPYHLDLEQLVKNVNTWSNREPKYKELFGKVPIPGAALAFSENAIGVTFTIYPPFMIPYFESYYQIHDVLPEYNLDELIAGDVIECFSLVQECLDDPITLDLSQWDVKRRKLTYKELVYN